MAIRLPALSSLPSAQLFGVASLADVRADPFDLARRLNARGVEVGGEVDRAPRTAARRALSGHVFAPIGAATNYHADWIVPYWIGSLDKIA